jgi:DNA polymerase-4
VADPIDSVHGVFAVAADLLDSNLPRGAVVRLLGVRVEQLVRGAVAGQLTLLDGGGRHSGTHPGAGNESRANWSDAEHAADAARSRFGSAAVRLATLLETPARSGRGDTRFSTESGNQID